jgi:hypothetical protein
VLLHCIVILQVSLNHNNLVKLWKSTWLEETQRVKQQMRGYMDSYYTPLRNPQYAAMSDQEKNNYIDSIVGQGMATGGRVGLQQGGIMPRLNELGGGVSSAEEMLQDINTRLESADSKLGNGGASAPQGFSSFEEMMKLKTPNLGQPNFYHDLEGVRRDPQGNLFTPKPGELPQTLSRPRPEMDPKYNANFSFANMNPAQPGLLKPLEENQNFQNVPEEFRSGFANYLKENSNSFGFGGQAMSSVGLPGGGSVTFGDTGSAGAFRDYLKSTGFDSPSPLGQPLPGLPGVETIQASGTFNGNPLFPEGTTFPSGGVSLEELYPNAGQNQIVSTPDWMRPGNMPGTDVPYSTLRGGMGSPLQNALGLATGGRVGLMGGTMPMGEPRVNQGGITELDYRAKGGFVPVGIKEKADDVPAMLSKNEFVFTADAVRGAGNGSVEKGAQKMYDTMKNLERRVT